MSVLNIKDAFCLFCHLRFSFKIRSVKIGMRVRYSINYLFHLNFSFNFRVGYKLRRKKVSSFCGIKSISLLTEDGLAVAITLDPIDILLF